MKGRIYRLETRLEWLSRQYIELIPSVFFPFPADNRTLICRFFFNRNESKWEKRPLFISIYLFFLLYSMMMGWACLCLISFHGVKKTTHTRNEAFIKFDVGKKHFDLFFLGTKTRKKENSCSSYRFSTCVELEMRLLILALSSLYSLVLKVNWRPATLPPLQQQQKRSYTTRLKAIFLFPFGNCPPASLTLISYHRV